MLEDVRIAKQYSKENNMKTKEQCAVKLPYLKGERELRELVELMSTYLNESNPTITYSVVADFTYRKLNDIIEVIDCWASEEEITTTGTISEVGKEDNTYTFKYDCGIPVNNNMHPVDFLVKNIELGSSEGKYSKLSPEQKDFIISMLPMDFNDETIVDMINAIDSHAAEIRINPNKWIGVRKLKSFFLSNSDEHCLVDEELASTYPAIFKGAKVAKASTIIAINDSLNAGESVTMSGNEDCITYELPEQQVQEKTDSCEPMPEEPAYGLSKNGRNLDQNTQTEYPSYAIHDAYFGVEKVKSRDSLQLSVKDKVKLLLERSEKRRNRVRK